MKKDPMMRNIIMDHISYDANLRQFKKKTILDCIDKFEQDLDTDLFLENIDYFIKNGYVEIFKLPIHDETMDKFYIELEDKCSFITDSLKSQLQNFRQRKIDPHEIMRLDFKKYQLSNNTFNAFMEILEKMTYEYYENMGQIEDKNIQKFLQMFFLGSKGLENTLRYLLELERYIKEYLGDNIHAMDFKNTLCKRLNHIVNIFEL